MTTTAPVETSTASAEPPVAGTAEEELRAAFEQQVGLWQAEDWTGLYGTTSGVFQQFCSEDGFALAAVEMAATWSAASFEVRSVSIADPPLTAEITYTVTTTGTSASFRDQYFQEDGQWRSLGFFQVSC